MMQWTVRLEARTDTGEGKTTELVTLSRPAVAGTFVDVGLALSEAKALLSKVQESMVQSQVAEYATCRRVCPECGVLQPLKEAPSTWLLGGLRCGTKPGSRTGWPRPLSSPPTLAIAFHPRSSAMRSGFTSAFP